MKTAGQILVETLAAYGAERVFCVAGESYLPVLDALLDVPEIEVVTCRHESGATFMAEAYGFLHGDKPGIAMVTRGPGACNASIGIHAAKQSSSPLVMFVGLVAMGDRDKEAFQEFDLPQMFGSHTKWAAVIDRADRMGEYVTRALHVAVSGRPGPVVLGLPEDILAEMVDTKIKVIPPVRVAPSPHDIERVLEALRGAERPLIIAGGGGWSDADCENLAAFASASHIPVAASFRRQDLVNHKEGHYVGELGTGPNPKLVENVKRADVILAIGSRLGEITSQSYSLLQPGQKIIHVFPEAEEFGKSCMPDIAVQAHAGPFVAALSAHRIDGRNWNGWREELRAEYLNWSDTAGAAASQWNGADMTAVFAHLRRLLPADSIITTDAGNFSGWAQRYLQYGRPNRLLAPISGAMGYAVPSAISASLAYPGRVVLGLCGDGGFMMTGQEIATAIRHKATPIIMVCNNSMYGTIRMHQERDFPGRISATALTNPDFVKLAQSYGAFGGRVGHADEFEGIWNAAINSGLPALIEITMDPRQITTRARI
jgi:acetolactate synthase-1/2/3 large subunit